MTDLTTVIQEVTVYADRALVTRGGTIHLTPGEHELRINDLPTFIRESLRAAGQGPQGTRILNVDITTSFYSSPPEQEMQTLRSACDLLQQRIDLIKARQAALSDRRQWLRALGEQSREFAKGLASGQMKPQDCGDFFSFAATQALENAEAEQDLGVQLHQLEMELAAKQREIASKQGYGHPDRLAALVNIEMLEEGDFTLELSYLVTQAWWRPQYDVRVIMADDGNRGEVELTYIGLVQQSTGENWNQVSLALSTARPSQAAVLPELQPQYVNIYSPPPPAPMYAMPAAAPGASGRAGKISRGFGAVSEEIDNDLLMPMSQVAEQYMDEKNMPAVEASIATATVEQSGTAYVFRVGRSVDIPSDQSPHKTTIARDNLPCEFDYVSAPILEATAHLRATITNTSERVLLAGESSIFLSGEYVGTTKISMTAPREQFKIFLGIDDSIKVKREQIERTVEKGALLQGMRRITYAYRITIHNYALFPRTIVLRDRIPVPQHERVKVKTQAIVPPPVERTKLELLTWNIVMPADGDYKLEYRFTIEHPQDVQVIGLP
ncbi:MAG TPA: mucoidy inhibitor MuiA family protein [Ktedonobacteraceae bacterium]|nr:mucoidy inhibitor MuiA family protein [Ktedonobacteraceae bacterium]